MTPRCAALQSAVSHAEASLKRSEEATERTRQELAELRQQLEAEISRDAALSWETMKRT